MSTRVKKERRIAAALAREKGAEIRIEEIDEQGDIHRPFKTLEAALDALPRTHATVLYVDYPFRIR